MPNSIAARRFIRLPRRAGRPLLALLGATLVLLAGCAPRATVHGADPLATALQGAAERADTAPLDRSADRRTAVAGSGGAQLMRAVAPSVPVARRTVRTPSRHGTPKRAVPASAAAPPSALIGAAWIGHYAASGPAPRTALGLALRESAASHAQGAALTGELLLWAAPGRSVFDAADAGRAPGRVVRVPLARADYVGGQLRMTTEPFLDPACGCTVHGVFTGAVRADTLAGRFTLVGASTVAPRGGRWALVRRPAR